jgi:hypothetical protein
MAEQENEFFKNTLTGAVTKTDQTQSSNGNNSQVNPETALSGSSNSSHFDKVIKFLSKDSVTLLLLIILAYLGIVLLSKRGNDVAYKLFAPLEYGFTPTNTKINNQAKTTAQQVKEFNLERANRLKGYSNNLKATGVEKQRILEQLQKIQSRQKVTINVVKFFYIEYYIAISMASVSAVIAAICLLLISKVGWEKAKNPTVNIFIVSSAIFILFSTFIVMFKQESNITENKKLYLAYAALEDRIISYLVTNEFLVNKGSSESQKITKPTQVIQSIDSELATLNNIAIGFDSTKIPNYQELYKTIPPINQP